MSWMEKVAEAYVVNVNSKPVRVTDNEISALIKTKLRKSPSMQSLFEQYEMDLNRLDDLRIEIIPLDKKYAETDAKSMRLNQMLFRDGRFFEDYFFVVCHEVIHWMSRVKEEEAYFNDPEEVLGFVASIAFEMESNTDPNEIWNKIYNKVAWHFHDESDAREFFGNMVVKAKELIAKQSR